MKNIAQYSVERPLYPWLLMIACLLGGWYGIESVGRLEDPAFPIKNAFVITPYPGASAVEVEQEVTDVIEAALQQLPYLYRLTSKSVPGRSEVQIEIQEQYDETALPQIWDELRRRVGEAVAQLPPGVGIPHVEDDFGDVYGLLYAVIAPDYSPGEVHDISRQIALRLKTIEGVAKVAAAGEPEEAIFVELNHERLVRLGLPIDAVFNSINTENQVVGAGSLAYGERRVRIAPELAFDSVTAVEDLRIGRPGSTEILRLGDIASVTRGPVETPSHIIRHGGRSAFTIGVSVTQGLNVVDVGAEVDAEISHLLQTLPLGVEIVPVYRQHAVVNDALGTFLKNLGLSVATVVGALCLFMGWRAGAVVGSVLLLTVFGTLYIMAFLGIELQRISIGALMIAMGMLVDNAIVIAEGMVIGVRRGLAPPQAAAESVSRTQFPLLGATVIGILAFAPIGLSQDSSGQFLRSLFQVVSISLLLSWVLAITIAPLLGSYLLKATSGNTTDIAQGDDNLYRGPGYAFYRLLVRNCLRHVWLSTLGIIAITLVCLWGFAYVKQAFFPSSNAPLFFVDVYLPQGTDIHTTTREVSLLEKAIFEETGVEQVSAFIGRGATRYTATQRPEQPNPAYAHLLVRVQDVTAIDAMIARLNQRLPRVSLDADIQLFRIEFTSGGTSKIEARFSGPDTQVLRALADQASAIYLRHNLIDRKLDWRQPEIQLVPVFDEAHARVAGIGRQEVYQALAFAASGVPIGLYRDADKLLPIVARAPSDERLDVTGLPDRLVWSNVQQTYIPMSQLVSEFRLVPEDTLIHRRQRVRTLSVMANAPRGHNLNAAFNQLRPDIEAIKLPPGYSLEWGGEYESSERARTLLLNKIPLTFGTMFLITLLMFGKVRQSLVIWFTVPMTVCGVVISLLATDMPFTFPAFLGFLSLSGMLIKNSVVLVDEIDKRAAENGLSIDTITEASVSRLRPVLLATGTTIAGMSPLLGDAFFDSMAVCIMGGLAFSTLLTLIAVPVFYRSMLFSRNTAKNEVKQEIPVLP
ncbi:MAG: efflux RND transporter permease subunit [Pseudomonadota bacterium]